EVPVVVPAAEVDRHEGTPGLDQAPGQQRALPPVVPAVGIAQPRLLAADVEGVARRRADDELVRLAAEAVHRLGRRRGVEFPAHRCPLLAPLTPMSLAVSMRWPPAKWSPVLWCSERTTENLSVTRACRGNSSLMSKPGTRVRIGRQMPRYSAGASGFRSYRSMWLGPPSSHIRITDVFLVGPAEAADSDFARRSCGRPTAAMPATPSWRKL